MNEIEINGITYIQKPTAPSGTRAVVVVDRGWIFAGDVEDIDGRIWLTRAVHVFSWERIGFNGVLENPEAEGVDIRVLEHDVDLPASAEIFRIPVDDSWGL